MTKNYEIVLNYIKDLSVEIPDAETFLFSRENITKYTLGLNISTNPIKDQTIEVITNLNYKDKSENKLSHGPKLRFFKSVNLLEIGLDNNKDLILNLIIRF